MWWYIEHRFKRFFRAATWEKALFIKVIVGIVVSFLLLEFAVLAFLGGKAVGNYESSESLFQILAPMLPLYILGEFLLRSLLQSNPKTEITPYLLLPIKKSRLIHFSLISSGLSLLNFGFLILQLAFTCGAAGSGFQDLGACLLLLLSLSISLHFLVTLINQAGMRLWWLQGIVFVGFIALGCLLYYGQLQFQNLMLSGAASWIDVLPLSIVLLVVSVLLYLFCVRQLRLNFYRGPISVQTSFPGMTGTWFSSFGKAGLLMGLELKLILRNKRPRQLAMVAMLFIFWANVFFKGDDSPMLAMLFGGIFITSTFMMNYGQFLGAWEGSHYDFLLTRDISFEDYYKAKLFLFIFSSLITFVPCLLIFANNQLATEALIASLLYNCGINSYLWMYISVYNRTAIDLSRPQLFNYQGVSASQMLLVTPIMIIAPAIAWIVSLCTNDHIALYVLGGLGITGFLLMKPALSMLARRLQDRKYEISEAFRLRE